MMFLWNCLKMGTEMEKLFSIYRRENPAVSVSRWKAGKDTEGVELYQVRDDLLQELGTFLHLVLRTPQLDDVALLRRVGEINDDLKADGDEVKRLNKSLHSSDNEVWDQSHLRKLVSNFFDLFPLLSDDCPVELLLHDQVFGPLILLDRKMFRVKRNPLSLRCSLCFNNQPSSPFSGPSRWALFSPTGLL